MMASLERVWAIVRSFARNLLRRDQVERDLSEEIDSYADLLIDEKVAEGMPRDERRRTGS